MEYLVQAKNEVNSNLRIPMGIEEETVIRVIKSKVLGSDNKVAKYRLITDDMMNNAMVCTEKGKIPVGNIGFVQKYLERAYGIKHIKPIEVPKCIRKEEFLNRWYTLGDRKRVEKLHFRHSEEGVFVKRADQLKTFTNETLDGKIPYQLDDGLYVISEWVCFKSEYRVFVLNDKVVGCMHYYGDILTFPNKSVIINIIDVYKQDSNRPKAYTIDLGIIIKDGKEKTSIIEVHNFSSCGLYGYDKPNLLKMYEYGTEWLINNEEYTINIDE